MIIVGAKGFAKELLQIIFETNPEIIPVFFDNVSKDLPALRYNKFSIINSVEEAANYFKTNPKFSLGVGGTTVRKNLCELMLKNGGCLQTVISSFARIGNFGNDIGLGCTIMTGAVLTNDIIIGTGCLINLNVTIGHDCEIGSFCDIAPGVSISGNVKIGDLCSLGTGAILLPRVTLGNNVTVGAGAVVNKDVPDDTTVVGIPAKPLNKNK